MFGVFPGTVAGLRNPGGGGAASGRPGLDQLADLLGRAPDEAAVAAFGQCVEALSRSGDMVGGGAEGSEQPVVVGQVQMQRGIEPGDTQALVVAVYPRVGESVRGVEGANVPDQCLRRIGVEVGEVVSEGAAVQRVTGGTDGGPQVREFTSRPVDFTAMAGFDGGSDRRHGRVGIGVGSGHDGSSGSEKSIGGRVGSGVAMGMAIVVRSPLSADRTTTGSAGPEISIITSGPMAVSIAG